ncbi:MAG: RNA polymerase sigma factor [Ilumatobacter sp.]|nr:RNA polymerase sigma factor [Ilumatobacter sp.]
MDEIAARLFDEHVDVVYGYVARRLGADLAADVVGDVFEIAVGQLDRYDPARGSERAWLFGIATNLVRRHWRTEQRRLRATRRAAGRSVVPGDPLLDVVDRLDASTDAERVLAAVGDLAPDDRDLLLLIAWEDATYQDCADVLGIPVGTVRSRLHRIRRDLQAAVGLGAPTPEALR